MAIGTNKVILLGYMGKSPTKYIASVDQLRKTAAVEALAMARNSAKGGHS